MPGRFLIARLLTAAMLAGALASPLAAQVRIYVVDESGRPVSAVRIDAVCRVAVLNHNPDLPPTYARFGTANLQWHLLSSGDRPCNTGISFFSSPPRTPEGMRFTECVAEHWRRR